MTAMNIMPYSEDSGSLILSYAPMKSGESFVVGEPVSINSSGQLTESADDPVVMDFGGIAAGPVSYVRGTMSAAGTAAAYNWETNAAYAALAMIPYYMALPGRRFVSPFLSSGASVLMAPAGSTISSAGTTYANATAITMVGQEAGLQITSGEWQIDMGMTANRETFRIEAFLDANKSNVSKSGQAACYVVVRVLQSQWLPITLGAAAGDTGSLAPIA